MISNQPSFRFRVATNLIFGLGSGENLGDEIRQIGLEKPAAIVDHGVVDNPAVKKALASVEKVGLPHSCTHWVCFIKDEQGRPFFTVSRCSICNDNNLIGQSIYRDVLKIYAECHRTRVFKQFPPSFVQNAAICVRALTFKIGNFLKAPHIVCNSSFHCKARRTFMYTARIVIHVVNRNLSR